MSKKSISQKKNPKKKPITEPFAGFSTLKTNESVWVARTNEGHIYVGRLFSCILVAFIWSFDNRVRDIHLSFYEDLKAWIFEDWLFSALDGSHDNK